MREIVLAAVRGLSQGFDLFQFLAAQFVNVFVESQEDPLTGNCALGALRAMKNVETRL